MAQRPPLACPLGAGRSVCSVLRLPAAPALARRRSVAASASGSGSSASDASGSSSSAAGQVSVAVSSPAAAPESGTKDPALLARIAQAKAKAQAYRQATGGSDASGSGAAAAAAAAAADAAPQLTEEQQEAMRQQYAAQLRQREQAAAASSDAGAYASYVQQLEQQQRQQQQQQQGGSGGGSALEQLAQQDASPPPRPPPARPDFYTSPDAPDALSLLRSTPQRAGGGSADEAAEWLKGVLAEQPGAAAFSPGMRQEEISAAKEAVQRQRGADIITAFPEDYGQPAQAQPGGEGTEPQADAAGADAKQGEDYKPRVTTWGVFPRPSNISQAYGGGRNIRPGQALETAEQRAKRESEYAAALQRYRAATFVDQLSDEELRSAQAAFDEGMALFKRGALQQALLRFDEVREKVPLKSKLGGMSTLQAAVCYDTLGNSRTAEALYKRIQGHPTSEVSRKAKQLVFGFQAMSFLKTENLSFAVKKGDYLKYFRRSADRTRVYVASEEERAADAEQARQAAFMALGVVLGPVLIMGALLAGSR